MNKKKRKNEDYGRTKIADAVWESGFMTIIIGALCLLLATFFAISPLNDKPISYAEAEHYTGMFERVTESKNYFKLYTNDGETYSFHSHTISREQRQSIRSIPKGTQVHISVNPNNGCIVELLAGSEKIIDFDEMQAEILSYEHTYLFIAAIPFLGGIFLILYPLIFENKKSKESKMKQ